MGPGLDLAGWGMSAWGGQGSHQASSWRGRGRSAWVERINAVKKRPVGADEQGLLFIFHLSFI